MTDSLLDERAVLEALADFADPETGRPAVGLDQIRDIKIDGSRLSLTLALSTHSAPLWNETKLELENRLKAKLPRLSEVNVTLAVLARPPQRIGEIGLAAKSVVAVGSGKGGVGKSTIAATIALSLARAGCKIGLMDADVYGPSIPHLLGVNRRPEVAEGRIQPIEVAGVKTISMGYLIPPGEAVVWRGPMLHGAITQFLRDTAWGELDYLIIDMPPGTGDIALTLSQLLPLTGAVVVCTPQDVALIDAVKAIAMFRKVKIPILGMVENMSGFVCTKCGERHDIFGHGGARQKAAELDIPFLGEAPINLGIRTRGDAGQMAEVFDDPAIGPGLEAIARTLARNIADAHRAAPPLPTLSVLG